MEYQPESSPLIEWGYTPREGVAEENAARVLAVHKERYQVACAHGVTYAQLKSGAYFSGKEALCFPTVGDDVTLQYNQSGDSLITGTLPRRSYFARQDAFSARGEQAVAANFDYVLLLQSLNHDFNLKRLERYLAIAWQSGATPVCVLTKADLCEDAESYLSEARDLCVGTDVYVVSAASGEGLDALRALLRPNRTLVFLGSSGVGKSTLVNAIAGEELMRTGDIREDDSKGRHTTTHRQMFRMPGGGLVIDTPGMREIGMWNASEGLQETFADISELEGQCRFADCAHEREPGCAIRAALISGALDEGRWQRYRRLQREASIADDRAAALRAKHERNKAIAKYSRTLKNTNEKLKRR